MDADLRLHLINDRIHEAHQLAAAERMAAAARAERPRPPTGPLTWLVRAGATAAATALVVLRSS